MHLADAKNRFVRLDRTARRGYRTDIDLDRLAAVIGRLARWREWRANEPPRMNLRQLDYFVHVAEVGS
ncbi:MAG: hypothetical protein ABIV63_02545, partial [Caldimonas sp.]